MKTQIQLILATVVITVLIWVYADLTSHETCDVHLPVKLAVPPNSDLVVRADGALSDKPDVVEIRVRLIGPKAAISKLERDKQTQGLALEIPVVTPEAGADDVRRPMDIREYINGWAGDRGFQVESLSRQTIEYTVDRIVWIHLVVEADPGPFAEDLKDIPKVEPSKVRARLLASQRDRHATAPRRLIVPIGNQLATHTDGTIEKSLVGQKWQGLDVTYIPNRVVVTVAWQEGGKRQRISSIPLWTLWPADPPEGYRIVWDNEADLVQHIEVVIPPGKPRPLMNTDVIAFVRIVREDFPPEPSSSTETAPAGGGIPLTREVRFHFPKGFEDVRVESPPRNVQFHLVREDITQPPG